MNAQTQEILENLKSQTTQIHKGTYPQAILKDLGKAGLYANFFEQKEKGLWDSVLAIYEVSKVCGNSGFCVWCQYALAWYLLNSSNYDEELFKKVSCGEILGGTGLSNPVKSFAGIESIKLSAKRVEGGFIVNGTLPWVSNIEENHFFGAIAKIEDEDDFVMGIIEAASDKVVLKENVHFIGLEGSATKSCALKDYFLAESRVVADPWSSLSAKIIPGFVLLQGGIALGLLDASLEVIENEKDSKGGINAFLPFSLKDAKEQRDELANRAQTLAQTPYDTSKEYFHNILKLKFDFAKLLLKASQAAMLATGTKGYLIDSKASKIWIESNFVAIVTPSMKHINKILNS